MNRIIVITGAASGIGRSLVTQYLQNGDRVAALDNNAAFLEKLSGEIASPALSTHVVDVSDEAQVKAVGEKIRSKLGVPDIWINNAGIVKIARFDATSSEDFERVIRVNFLGVVYGTRTAVSLMRSPERGVVVNVASVNGEVPSPFMASYVAAKHAVVGFTRSLQLEKELAQSPVRIVLVCPGFVKTPIMAPQGGFAFPRWLEWIVENPDSVADEILQGIEEGLPKITPTLNGKFITQFHRLAPRTTARVSRALTAGNWKELFGFSPIRK